DAGVGYVSPWRDNRHTGGPNLGHRAPYHGQHYIDIVNHEVHDDIDIQAPRSKYTEPVRLKEPGRSCYDPRRRYRGVEPLEVTDLQNGFTLLSKLHHVVGLFQRSRYRLFYQNRDAGFQEFAGDLMVENSWYRQADGIYTTYQFFVV